MKSTTVEPVLSGTVFSCHPLLSGHVVKPRKFRNISTIKVTLIERSPLLSGRGHLFQGPKIHFSLFETALKGQWKVTAVNIIQNILYSNHYSATCQSL